MIRIAARIGPQWLERPDDLAFLSSIGVEFVDVEFGFFPGFNESGGAPDGSSIGSVVDLLDGHGLRLERANYPKTEIAPHYLGQPEAGQAIDNVCRTTELCGEFGIPVMGIQNFDAMTIHGRFVGEHSWVPGRGGYRYLHIDVESDLAEVPPPPGTPTREELWSRTVDLFGAVAPVAESAGVKVAPHGSDPPIATAGGIPQMLTSLADFDRLFAEVPSPNVGITFCVGTRYESGEDVFEGIERFGGQKRIFPRHLRKLRGTIPEQRGYSEVAPDEGDLNMLEVARALDATGYDGVIDYDHVMKLPGDSPGGREYIAFCIGYMRGLLANL
ncbi:MAG: mannonate dehydratase [Chloroflexi bacterium]|nr:mannonate dehydratase [Chloroflexota bacterium]